MGVEHNQDGTTEGECARGSRYSANVYFDDEIASTALLLSYEDRHDPSQSISVGIAPDLGSNMFRFRVGAHEIIHCDQALLRRKDFTGSLVLWPFPNRMRGKRYIYQWQTYSLEGLKRPQGDDALIHGLVFDRQWQYDSPVFEPDAVSVTTCIQMTPESPFYSAYPFESRLSLTYTLTSAGVTVAYRVQNQGTKDLPFGFALHPYFSLLSGKAATLVSIPANIVMEADDELLPTGRLLKVDGLMYAMFDLRQPVPVGNLKLDHVYTGLCPGASAVIEYREQVMRLRVSASSEFTHIVVYTPPNAAFFCLESQTCSTDAVNLHHQGRKELAHLQEVRPGETSTGSIRYSVEFGAKDGGSVP